MNLFRNSKLNIIFLLFSVTPIWANADPIQFVFDPNAQSFNTINQSVPVDGAVLSFKNYPAGTSLFVDCQINFTLPQSSKSSDTGSLSIYSLRNSDETASSVSPGSFTNHDNCSPPCHFTFNEKISKSGSGAGSVAIDSNYYPSGGSEEKPPQPQGYTIGTLICVPT